MDDNKLHNLRHTLAHLLGASVLELYPESKLTLGPAIDNGFYYDVDVAGKITEEDLSKIEAKMRELLPTWETFSHQDISYDDAKKFYKENPYKLELIEDHKDEGLTLYKAGDFTDLCKCRHVEHPSKDIPSDSFKLDRIAGAYWRGDEKNKMLTRIYGLAFESKEKLDEHVEMQAEAEKRDHRKLGKELGLFVFSDVVGQGLPLWTEKGATIRRELE